MLVMSVATDAMRAACAGRTQYNMSFYLQYMSKWPDYFLVQQDPNGTIMGYSGWTERLHVGILPSTTGYRLTGCWCCSTVMGKAEGLRENWHGHVTAVTVAPEFRRLGLANKLMDYLGNVSEELYELWASAYHVRSKRLD
jgi:N-terminal acetyltransferase B complex catalytic subunit